MTELADETARILVALDSRVHSLNTLRLAAELAARRQAELLTLFMEDIDLLQLAGLPFARELDRACAIQRRLDVDQMARAMRTQAGQIRHMLSEVTGQLRLRSSLRIVRGHYVAEALSAAGELDVLFLAGLATLLQGESPSIGGPVWVVYDGSLAASRALTIAAELTPQDQELVVLIRTAKSFHALQRQARRLLSDLSGRVRHSAMPSPKTDDILAPLTVGGCRLLVLNRNDALRPDVAIKRFLEKIECPMVLVP